MRSTRLNPDVLRPPPAPSRGVGRRIRIHSLDLVVWALEDKNRRLKMGLLWIPIIYGVLVMLVVVWAAMGEDDE